MEQTPVPPSGPPAPPLTEALVEMPVYTLPANVQMTDFDDDSITRFEFDQYKGTKNRTDRLAVLFSKSIAIGRAHFQPGDGGGYYLCQSEIRVQAGAEVVVKPAICCERLKEPKKRFAVVVAQYHTDKDGNLMQPFGYDLKIWVFGSDKYVELRSLNREFPLEAHDLKLTCTDDNYQKLSIQACRESFVYSEAFAKRNGGADHLALQQRAASLLPKLSRAIGRQLTAAELAQKIGAAVAVTTAPTTDTPAMDIAELLR